MSDLPMAVLFLAFLLVFLLVGLFPALQRRLSQIRQYLETLAEEDRSDRAGPAGELDVWQAQPHELPQVNDFDVVLLRWLAQAGGRTHSAKRIAADLHLDPTLVLKGLEALRAGGLVGFAMSILAGRRFYLTKTGRAYAAAHGFLPTLRK